MLRDDQPHRCRWQGETTACAFGSYIDAKPRYPGLPDDRSFVAVFDVECLPGLITHEMRISLDEGVPTKFALVKVNEGDAVSDLRFFRKGHDPISIVTAQERLDPDIAPVISRKVRIRLGVWVGGRNVAKLWMKFTWSGKDRVVRAAVAADYESHEIKASLT